MSNLNPAARQTCDNCGGLIPSQETSIGITPSTLCECIPRNCSTSNTPQPAEPVSSDDELRDIFPLISNTQRNRLKKMFRELVVGERFDTSDEKPSGLLRRNKVKNGYRVEILQRLDLALGTKEKSHDTRRKTD